MTALETDLREERLRLGSATVYEASGAEGALDPAIAPIWPGAQVCVPALVGPGDVVVADADGVVVVRAERLTEVLEASRARVAKEEHVMARLREGELTLDLLGLRRPAG